MSRIKVLCIIDTLVKGGGAERLLVDLLPAMQLRGMDIAVVALFCQPGDHSDELECAGIPVHQLALSSPYAAPEAMWKLRALIREFGYKVLWGHLYYGNFYAWLASRASGQARVVTTIHSEGYLRTPPTRLRQRLAVALEGVVLSSAGFCVAVSRAVRHDYETYFGLSGIEIAYNGVDCAALNRVLPVDRAAVRAEFGFAPDDFLIVTPASLQTKKGHAVLIEAVAHLRDKWDVKVKALLCGDGPLKAELAGDIARRGLGDQVVLSPVIPHARLMPLVAAAEAVVMPSLREPFGIAAAEAMALGVPCVLTDVDGFREISSDGDSALLVPPGDSAALARAVDRLRRDPGEAAERAARARANVCATFDIGQCADRWIQLLGQAAA